MRRDAEGDESNEDARVGDPREVQHGEADLVAGQRDLAPGEMTGEFPSEKVVARRERRTLSTGKGAFLVGAGILLSRIVGVIRQRIFGYFLGTSAAMDAFNAAFRIPNFLQNVFGEGALSASFIPVYARLLAHDDEEEADRVAWSVFTLLAFVVSALVLAGVLATPLLINAIAPGFAGEKRALTIQLVRIFFPGAGLLVLSAWCLGVLNSHRRFFLSYTAPVVWNVTLVAALGYAQSLYTLPVSLFGISVSAAELPEMSSALGEQSVVAEKLRARLDAGLRQIALFIVPSSMGFLALGDVMAGALYQNGKFDREATVYVWAILAGSAVGLLASTLGRLYASTFYALHDTRTPLRYAVARVFLTTVLGYLFSLPLPDALGVPRQWGAVGLTASAGIAGWVEFALLRRGLNRRIGRTGIPFSYVSKLWLSAAASAAVAWGIRLLVGHVHPIPLAVLVLMPYG